jgi:hypothetical protein
MDRKISPRTWIPLIALSTVISGCDEEATRVARQAADRQAQQNTVMAELNKEVAGGMHQLVEADAKARHEIVAVHRDLQNERRRLDSNWSALEQERRQNAERRRTASLLVPAVHYAGLVVLVVALLGFCWYTVANARNSNDTDAALSELLIADMLSDQPNLASPETNAQSLLLPKQPAAPQCDKPSFDR